MWHIFQYHRRVHKHDIVTNVLFLCECVIGNMMSLHYVPIHTFTIVFLDWHFITFKNTTKPCHVCVNWTEISYCTWSNHLFSHLFSTACVLEIFSAGMWPTKKGRERAPIICYAFPLWFCSSHWILFSSISPPLSVLSCVQQRNVLENLGNCKKSTSVAAFFCVFFYEKLKQTNKQSKAWEPKPEIWIISVKLPC